MGYIWLGPIYVHFHRVVITNGHRRCLKFTYLAPRHPAADSAPDRGHGHGEVEAVDEADVIVVQRGPRRAERHLDYRGRGLPSGTAAAESAAAVAGLARALPVLVEAAALSAPYAPRPPGRHVEHHFLRSRQLESAVLRRRLAGAAHDPRPHAVGAVVY